MAIKIGTLKFFDVFKRYGFIIPQEGGDDIFIHASGHYKIDHFATDNDGDPRFSDEKVGGDFVLQGGESILYETKKSDRQNGKLEAGRWAVLPAARPTRSKRPWYTLPYGNVETRKAVNQRPSSQPAPMPNGSASPNGLFRGLVLSFDNEKGKGELNRDGDGVVFVFALNTRRTMTPEGEISELQADGGSTPVQGDRIAFFSSQKQSKGKPRVGAWILPMKDQPMASPQTARQLERPSDVVLH